MTVLDILAKYHEGLLGGLWVTTKLCLVVWVAGLSIGSLFAVAAARRPQTIGVACRVASFIVTGIPVLVLLFILHYPVQFSLGLVVDPFYTAAGALSLVNVLAVADVVRPAVADFPSHYVTVAQLCGLPGRAILRRIQVPLILRQVVPALLMLQVTMLQATLFASLISVEEIFRIAQRINAAEYRPVEVYCALGVFFLAVCLPLNGMALWLRHRFGRDLSER